MFCIFFTDIDMHCAIQVNDRHVCLTEISPGSEIEIQKMRGCFRGDRDFSQIGKSEITLLFFDDLCNLMKQCMAQDFRADAEKSLDAFDQFCSTVNHVFFL